MSEEKKRPSVGILWKLLPPGLTVPPLSLNKIESGIGHTAELHTAEGPKALLLAPEISGTVDEGQLKGHGTL